MALPGNQFLESSGPWIPEHGYILEVKPDRFQILQDDLSCRSECSQGVPTIPAALRRKLMMCFLETKRGYLTHAARSVVRYPAESGRDRLEVWNVIAFERPISIRSIMAKLQGPQAWRAKLALKGGHASATAFSHIMVAIGKADAAALRVIDQLINRNPASLDYATSVASRNWAYQRDATMTALEIARIPKAQLDISPRMAQDASPGVTSIFDDTEPVTTIEDLAILEDLDSVDQGWSLIKRQHYPAKTFTNGTTTLTVVLANKLKLEEQLGVDLIYVNETLRSVVFVQYKMFTGNDGEGGYRPDRQLQREIARMDRTTAVLAGVSDDQSCDGYRLTTEAFFMKFCSKLLSHDARGHVPGIYVPLGYWKRLVGDAVAKGPKGGTIVYAETFGRRVLTPTHFIDMVGRGWIGTSTLQSDVLVPYLTDALKGKKAVVLAVESTTKAEAGEE